MDILLWVVRAVIIAVGIILVVRIWKGKKEGKFRERYIFSFIAIGITTIILGIILLILSSITDLTSYSGWYLTVVGVVALIVGLFVRNFFKSH